MVQFDNKFTKERMEEIRRKEEESLISELSKKYGHEYIDLRGITINPKALHLISEEDARSGNIVAFETVRKRVSVAIRNPNNEKTKKVLAKLEGDEYEATIFMTSTASLEHGWKRYSDRTETKKVKRGVLNIDQENIAEKMKQFTTPESVAKYVLSIRTLNNASRISDTLESIFAGALALRASDIHIEPEVGGVRLRYRLDGVLHDVMDLEQNIYHRLISRLKLLSGMILNINDEAQDGRFSFSVLEKQIEVRASIIPGAEGESMVMRLLDPTVASFQLEQLGLNKRLYEVMLKELKRPNGLIITTGPTGSGKTTALYAFLQHTHTPEVKIITIENPVEYKVEGIVQTQVGDDYTFASGLRAILRQDPDIIMVGEIRDGEVASTAIHAAQTGHLVFSTLHTNSAVGSFPRLIDLGIDYRMIGSSVNLVLGQRLVRLLCTHCKKEHAASADEQRIIKQILKTHPQPPEFPEPYTLYESDGCEHCNHTGFKGRHGVYEAVCVDQAVEDAIIKDPREHIILEAAKPQGIPTMAEDGIEKVIIGITSFAELQRVVDLTDGRHVTKITEDSGIDDGFSSHII